MKSKMEILGSDLADVSRRVNQIIARLFSRLDFALVLVLIAAMAMPTSAQAAQSLTLFELLFGKPHKPHNIVKVKVHVSEIKHKHHLKLTASSLGNKQKKAFKVVYACVSEQHSYSTGHFGSTVGGCTLPGGGSGALVSMLIGPTGGIIGGGGGGTPGNLHGSFVTISGTVGISGTVTIPGGQSVTLTNIVGVGGTVSVPATTGPGNTSGFGFGTALGTASSIGPGSGSSTSFGNGNSFNQSANSGVGVGSSGGSGKSIGAGTGMGAGVGLSAGVH
ncbi:MAG: hypothetical protein ABI230_04305 [Aestuariivirga sp.]